MGVRNPRVRVFGGAASILELESDENIRIVSYLNMNLRERQFTRPPFAVVSHIMHGTILTYVQDHCW